jgi:hypothetical protein
VSRRLVVVLVRVLVALLLVVLAPTTTHDASSAAGARVRATITFNKNPHNSHRSTIVWKVERRGDKGIWKTVERASWRAGSGFEGAAATNECAKGRGWLPNGTYSFIQYDAYSGQLIKGRVFYLGNKACRNGTRRTELFIHTESGRHNKQCRDRKGDQLCRWEYPKINDYKSFGCIKMSPADLKALVGRFHDYFRARVRYNTGKVRVRVIS